MKKNNIFKTIISLLIIVTLCINSFAAIVADNDGSAFITKAEFDSLKNDFQSQLDSYNTSIDSKIDSAISSYLAGISVSKTTQRDPYVSNYADIMWQPNYKVYGQWKKWTNNTTKTQSSGNVWFTPSFAEKRLSWRSYSWNVWDIMEHAFGELIMYFSCVFSTMTDGLAEGPGAYVCYPGHSQTCPTLTLALTKDTTRNNWYIGSSSTKPLRNMYVLTNDTYSTPHTVNKISGESIYMWSYAEGVALNSAPVFSTPGSGQYLKYNFKVQNKDGGQVSEYQSVMDKNNTIFPYVWRNETAFTEGGFSASNNATVNSSAARADADFFATGCTWHYLDDSSNTAQINLLNNMMLGSNYDQDVNIAKQISTKTEGTGFDMSESTQFATATGTTSYQCITEPNYILAAGDGGWNYNVDMNIKVPHWPTEKLRQQTSNKFVYGSTPLKIGQGLPLYVNVNQSGDVQISFDYKINYALNSTEYTSSQDLYIDLKKGDFLDKSTTTSHFYEAYNDLVQSSKTTLPKYRYKDYKYPSRTGKIKITVPMSKGESVWFRMRPSNESGGYYAKMSNLKVELVTE